MTNVRPSVFHTLRWYSIETNKARIAIPLCLYNASTGIYTNIASVMFLTPQSRCMPPTFQSSLWASIIVDKCAVV